MRYTIWLVIGLLLFGGVSNMLLATGVYDVNYSDQLHTPFDDEDITMLSEGFAESEDNPVGGLDIGYAFATTVLGALVSVLTIIPLGLSIGIPLPVIMIFQAPVWVLYAVELYALHKQVVLS